MWRALGRLMRRVGVVLWVCVVVSLAPSQVWASTEAPSTDAPTSTSGSGSSLPDQSSTTSSPATSSSTGDSPDSGSVTESPALVQLEPEQWSQIMDALDDEGGTAPETASGTVVLDPEQWDEVTTWATAFGLGFAVLCLVVSAGVVASWGRNS